MRGGMQAQIEAADGSFDLALPSDSYKVACTRRMTAYWAGGRSHRGAANGAYDLGTLTLLPRMRLYLARSPQAELGLQAFRWWRAA